jgi:hypothetical protein
MTSAGDISSRDDDDTTQMVRVQVAPQRADAGYVPPVAPAAPSPARACPARALTAPGRRGTPWALIGTLFVLGAAALVVVLGVLPLLELGREGGGENSPTAAPSAEPGSNTVMIPDLVGESTAGALDTARASGLDWTLYCNEDQGQPEGIIDQEPPAGTAVAPGSTFSLYSARFADCQ